MNCRICNKLCKNGLHHYCDYYGFSFVVKIPNVAFCKTEYGKKFINEYCWSDIKHEKENE